METSVQEILDSYDAEAPLDEAWTIPAPWYVDERVAELERRTVFSRTWQMVGRLDQLAEPGQYVTAMLAGEPIVVVRGEDRQLRGFFNVCRHHAAAVMTEEAGEGADPALPVPRVDVLARGRAQGHAGLRGRVQLRQGQERARARRDGESGRSSSSCASSRAGPPLETDARSARRPVREARARALPLRRAAALDLRVQLESLRRQLPRRRLPRAAPPQEPLLGPRLQPVHDRDRATTGASSGARSTTRTPRATWRPCAGERRRSTTGSTRTSWSTGTRASWTPTSSGPLGAARLRGHLRLLLHRRRDARGDRALQGLDRRRQPRPGRGPRDLRLGAAGPDVAGLPGRAPLGSPRGRRAPLPPDARRRTSQGRP